MPIIIDVHIDSLHVGHKTGLYYNGDDYDHKPSKSQRWLWKCWEKMWREVEILKKKHKAKLHISILGEAGDIDWRNRSGQFWSKNYKTVRNNAIKVLEPYIDMADWVHFFRGTEAHVGDEGTVDELIAENFVNIVKTEDGRSAHAHATYTLNNVLFDVAHHGKNRSKWAEENMLTALRNEIVLDRAKEGQPIPDVISRGHMHWSGETSVHKSPLAVQVPSFQLPYEFIFRIDPVVKTPHVGAAIFICEKGKFDYLPIVYKPERTKAWKP